jgi:hypothetical protein
MWSWLLVVAVGWFAATPLVADESQPIVTAGWIEVVRILPGELDVKAKLDTGARTSSLDAPDVENFEKDGKPWVRFGFTTNAGTSTLVERPVKRVARIKDLTGPHQLRSVIEIGVCLADRYAITEVTLYDRTGFNYRLLLGRSFLIHANVVVDPNATHLTRAHCADMVPP